MGDPARDAEDASALSPLVAAARARHGYYRVRSSPAPRPDAGPEAAAREPTIEERWTESNGLLVEEIRRRIEDEGPITFARFMELALYDEHRGYYRVAATRPGRDGDFLTATEAHPLFGHAVARQLDEMWRLLGRPHSFGVREYGAGSGALALGIMDGLRSDGSGLLAALRYETVETNPTRRAELAERLDAAGFGARLAGPGRGGRRLRGCVLANEFIDALPAHRVEMRDGGLHEIYVGWRDGWFAEEPGPPSTPELAAYLERDGIGLAEGQRAEINLAALRWVAGVAASLKRGYVLVLDYGYPARELFSPGRSAGTLRAYFRHGVHADPYRLVGEQDLTAHVDFTALQRVAGEFGLEALGLTTQGAFLVGAGIAELLAALQPRLALDAYLRARAEVGRLIDPRAMGRFRVLVLGRGVPQEPILRGLRATA